MIHDTTHGVLADTDLQKLLDTGSITGGQIQPASMDLELSSQAYQIRASFLPRGRRLIDAVEDVALEKLVIPETGIIVMPGTIFLVALKTEFALPNTISARANPKSSTGRLDIFVRLLCDRSTSYDTIPAGYAGRVWLEIAPKTFPVRIHPGNTLVQVRFKTGNPDVNDTALRELIQSGEVISDADVEIHRGLCLGIDLIAEANNPIGYRARQHADVIDLNRINAYGPRDFWEPLEARNGKIILHPDAFYILASKERIGLSPRYAAEMTAYDPSIAEGRVHYAGFIDPGFGWGLGNTAKGVLEVRMHDVPLLVEHGQTIAKLVFEKMLTVPNKPYGSAMRSNYQGQGLKLSKFFTAT